MQKSTRIFTTPVILIGGVELSGSDKVEIEKLDFPVLCADGGLQNACNAGLNPKMVIGDLDSVDQAQVGGIETVEIQDQNQTATKRQRRQDQNPRMSARGFASNRGGPANLVPNHVMAKYLAAPPILCQTRMVSVSVGLHQRIFAGKI